MPADVSQTIVGADFETVRAERRAEADAFYATIVPAGISPDGAGVMRQALGGLLWSKQFYHYVIKEWLDGDPAQPPPPPERRAGRNHEWIHLYTEDVISMPDKWEYPWFAAWDLAFHCVALAIVDSDLAKRQLQLLVRDWYMHPNGQLPAYEWAFGDVNPPVHAWAALRVYKIEKKRRGTGDVTFLKQVFHRLLLNFTWWVNRKDAEGMNVFQGGFLGLDNIGVFDRSRPLPSGGLLEQSDGTSWMAMYTLNMLAIAMELACQDHAYEDVASKFFEHFIYIADAMNNIGADGVSLWNEDDGFYYDVVRLPSGDNVPIKLRSMVGLIPLLAVEVLDPGMVDKLPNFRHRLEWFIQHRPDLTSNVASMQTKGNRERRLLSVVPGAPAAVSLQVLVRRARVLVSARRAIDVPNPPRPSVHRRGQRSAVPRRLCAGGVGDRSLRRQLQLARPRVVPRELSADRGAAEVPSLLRRQRHRGMPDRIGPHDDARRGRDRSLAAAVTDLSQGRTRPASRLRQRRHLSTRSPLEWLHPVP